MLFLSISLSDLATSVALAVTKASGVQIKNEKRIDDWYVEFPT